jgi:hypothetical protein
MEPPTTRRRHESPASPAPWAALRAAAAQLAAAVATAAADAARFREQARASDARHRQLTAQRRSLLIQAARAENDAASAGLLSLDSHILASVAAFLTVPALGRLARTSRRFHVERSITPSADEAVTAVEGARQRRLPEERRSIVEEGARLALQREEKHTREWAQHHRTTEPRFSRQRVPWLRLLLMAQRRGIFRWGFVAGGTSARVMHTPRGVAVSTHIDIAGTGTGTVSLPETLQAFGGFAVGDLPEPHDRHVPQFWLLTLRYPHVQSGIDQEPGNLVLRVGAVLVDMLSEEHGLASNLDINKPAGYDERCCVLWGNSGESYRTHPFSFRRDSCSSSLRFANGLAPGSDGRCEERLGLKLEGHRLSLCVLRTGGIESIALPCSHDRQPSSGSTRARNLRREEWRPVVSMQQACRVTLGPLPAIDEFDTPLPEKLLTEETTRISIL